MHTVPTHVVLAAALAIPLALPAQQPGPAPVALSPRAFLPADYTLTVFIDGELIRKTSLYDAIERSMLANMALSALRETYGIRGLDVDRLTIAGIQEKTAQGTRRFPHWVFRRVALIESSAELALPAPMMDVLIPRWDIRFPRTVAGHPVIQEGPDRTEGLPPGWAERVGYPRLWVRAGEKCLVCGDDELIGSVLRGERRGGVPHPELMPFTGGRHVAASCAGRLMEFSPEFMERVLPAPFDWYTEADKPTLLAYRLRIDPETEAVDIAATMRFESGKTGPKRFEERLRACIAEHRERPILRLLKPFLARLKYEIDGRDLVVHASFGSVEEFTKALPLSVIPCIDARGRAFVEDFLNCPATGRRGA